MTTLTQSPACAAIKARQHQMWASGDENEIRVRIPRLSEPLCDAVEVPAAGRSSMSKREWQRGARAPVLRGNRRGLWPGSA